MDKTNIELFWNDVKLNGDFTSNIHDGSLSIYESNPILNIVFSQGMVALVKKTLVL